MALTAGVRLGPYEIVSALGAGGMGEVYRATDLKLKREVAVKILPALLAADAERVARFQREAEVLASLNHPHIAAIYGLEEAEGVKALVMELVEGEDLAQRLERGPIPVDEVLPIARQIAEALEAAHEAGIVHRDLKPANIKVRPDATVKVLDFGLAKLVESHAATASNADRQGRFQLPTITSPAMMTGVGMILGTAAYMSPEQARGNVADKRADIWAFGVVIFEMLAGQRAFEGQTISDTLASVLKSHPNWRALPVGLPSRLRELLGRCLEKDPKRRLRDIGEARVQIEDVLAGTTDDVNAVPDRTAGPIWRRVLPWALVAGLSVTVMLMLWLLRPATSAPSVWRLSVEGGADVPLSSFGAGDAITLSRNGDVLAFIGQRNVNGNTQLYVRRLAQLQATALAGTEGAASPFFSPDGEWIGFFADGKLKKIAAIGGPAVELCDSTPQHRGGVWGEDGTIVFQPNRVGGLMRVSAAGGKPEALTSLAEGENTHRWPELLPGGKAVIFTASSSPAGTYNEAKIVVQPLPTGARRVLPRAGYHARYLSSGHLAYVHDGDLFAVPFDVDRLEVTGGPVPVAEGVLSNQGAAAAQFAVSATDALVYLPGSSSPGGWPIHWMDQAGTTPPLRAAPAPWFNLTFDRDGGQLAFQVAEGTVDIWVYELARETFRRVTSDPAPDNKPVWTPDARRLVFASSRGDKSINNLYWERTDGTGGLQRLTDSKNPQQPGSFHPSGKLLAFAELNPDTDGDLMILPLEGAESTGWKPGKATVFSNKRFAERDPIFSPDGQWIAYVSNEAGPDEVYVRPYPGPGSQSQISTGGGHNPVWSRTKRELFYGTPPGDGTGQIAVVPYTVEGGSFKAEKSRLWSEGRYQTRGTARMFDLHPDGRRFAVAPLGRTAQSGAGQAKLTFILNFFEHLRRVAPRAR